MRVANSGAAKTLAARKPAGEALALLPLERSAEESRRCLCPAVSAHRQQIASWELLLVKPGPSPKQL